MSSTYRAICLSHDPAMPIYGHDDEDLKWTSQDAAVAAVRNLEGDLKHHKDCDLVIGQYSYPLVAIICPPNSHRPTGVTRTGAPCWHNNEQEIDADWLRLMVAAIAEPNRMTAAAVEKFSGICWRPNRVNKLRFLVNPSDD